MLPLVIAAVAIIYTYILKIIITRVVPSNEIFRILAGLFIVACPTWILNYNFASENKLIKKITGILPYLYMPFILLEIYSIGTRVIAYGLTPARYISCIFIIFQIIILFLTVYKKREKLHYALLGLATLIVIVTISPFNWQTVSNKNQLAILKKTLPEGAIFSELDEDSKDKVRSSYSYLKYEEKGKNLIPEYISEEVSKEILKYNNYSSSAGRTEYTSYRNEKINLDISEYSKIRYTSFYKEEDNYQKIFLKDSNDGVYKIEMVDMMLDLIKQKLDNKEVEDYMVYNVHNVNVQEDVDFYITRLYMSYDKETQDISYFSLEGYILVK